MDLVINPYYPPFLQHFYNYDIWKKQIEVATGLSIHDYSQSVFDTQGFGDYQHLNKHGAKLYIDILLRDDIL